MAAQKATGSRQTSQHKHKAQRKVAEARRKAKRGQEAVAGKSRLKKDPGIPRLFPLKGKVLTQIAEHRATQEAREANVPNAAASLLKKHKQQAQDSDYDSCDGKTIARAPLNQQRYYKEFSRVIEGADVVLIVLDARDPEGTRARHVEDLLRRSARAPKVVLVLNKIDLVPRQVAQDWLRVLRCELPAVAFKANTQSGSTTLGCAKTPAKIACEAQLSSSDAIGTEALLSLLKNYSRTDLANVKTNITVGVVGYPNVGKSSLINSLKRTRVCNVGALPGVTRNLQEIVLDKTVRLIDCPGIVFTQEQPGMSASECADVALRNCIAAHEMDDPNAAVARIIERVSPSELMTIYNVSAFSTCEEFLAYVAQTRGKLRRGGILDLEAAARLVVEDWNRGKIPYFTPAPERGAPTQLDVAYETEADRAVFSALAPAFEL